MVRIICLLSLAWLAGCAAWGGMAFEQGAAGQYDFNWRLSGDPAVAPLQVFGTGRQIWLQFPPGQEVPAIFASTPQGDLPLAYRRQDPYVVIDGAWQALTLRGGRYVARASRQDVPVASSREMPVAAANPPAPAGGPAKAALTEHVPLVHVPLVGDTTATPVVPVQPPRDSSGRPSASAAGEPATAHPVLAPMVLHAGPPDATLRGVLARWAAASGWTFEPQHWAVDVDIPLAGAAEFPGDFKQAVRALLASTELSERPVQPCFYANQVLRVVAYTQACDRSAAPAGAAS
ncbi:MAG TPA: TcpQ domain-containing protein [Bordetella sp.]